MILFYSNQAINPRPIKPAAIPTPIVTPDIESLLSFSSSSSVLLFPPYPSPVLLPSPVPLVLF